MALVRLKPYNPRRGHKLRRFTSIKLKLKMRGDRGWYEIANEAVVAELREICQNGSTVEVNEALGIESKLAFDIAADRDEALRIESSYRATKGREAKKVVGTVDAPVREARPGRKAKSEAKPKTRKRKSANDKVRESSEPTADELAEARTKAIGDLVEEKTVKELRAMAKALGEKIPRGSSEEEIAAIVVDAQAAADEFGDD